MSTGPIPMPAEVDPTRLILVRHGESVLNAANRFTGLLDVPLTDRGCAEAVHAGQLIRGHHLAPEAVFTSLLTRTIDTARLILAELGGDPVDIRARWELNERNYGDLTGRERQEIRRRFGDRAYRAWRRTVSDRPPELEPTDPRHPRNLFAGDPRVPEHALAGTESLRQVIVRVTDFLDQTLAPALAEHSCVLVVGHGNSLRAVRAVLDGMSDSAVEALNIPTGQPRLYEWDRRSGQVTADGGRYLDPAGARSATAVLTANGGT